MKDLRTILAEVFPDEVPVADALVQFSGESRSRLGRVPVGWARFGSIERVPMIETDRYVYLDQRPSAMTMARRGFRIALVLALVSAATLVVPMSAEWRAACLIPGALGGMIAAAAFGSWQLNRGAGGLANIVVIDKSLAERDAIENGVRVLAGEVRRDRLFHMSFPERMDRAGRLEELGHLGAVDPLYRAPLFRFVRRHAPGRTRVVYRIQIS